MPDDRIKTIPYTPNVRTSSFQRTIRQMDSTNEGPLILAISPANNAQAIGYYANYVAAVRLTPEDSENEPFDYFRDLSLELDVPSGTAIQVECCLTVAEVYRLLETGTAIPDLTEVVNGNSGASCGLLFSAAEMARLNLLPHLDFSPG